MKANKKKIKKIVSDITQLILSGWITKAIFKLDIKSKIKGWRVTHFLYIFFLIPISILTMMILILSFEGIFAHLFGNPRCSLSDLDIFLDKFCGSYFGLMFGIIITAIIQIFIYWHYISSLKKQLFSIKK